MKSIFPTQSRKRKTKPTNKRKRIKSQILKTKQNLLLFAIKNIFSSFAFLNFYFCFNLIASVMGINFSVSMKNFHFYFLVVYSLYQFGIIRIIIRSCLRHKYISMFLLLFIYY